MQSIIDVNPETLEPVEPITEKRGRGRPSLIEEIERHSHEIASKVSGKVIAEVMAEAEKKAAAIIARAEALATPKHVVVGVKVGDRPTMKMQGEKMHAALPTMLAMLESKIWPMLVGPPGSGKTHMAAQAAKALNVPFGSLTASAGLSEGAILGRWLPTGDFMETDFIDKYTKGGLFLLDEADAFDANLTLQFNTAMANGFFNNPLNGKHYKRNENFYCIAAANTWGTGADAQMTGRNRLDRAFLERFFPLEIGYDADLEKVLCPNDTLRNFLLGVRKKLSDMGSKQTISPRVMMQAFTLIFTAGIDSKTVFNGICGAWPEQLRKDCFGNAPKTFDDKKQIEEIPF